MAIVFVLVVPITAGLGPEPERIALIDARGVSALALSRMGVRVIDTYETGYVLAAARNQVLWNLELNGLEVRPLPERTIIEFVDAGVRFDTTQGEPAIDPDLRAEATDNYIVQFIGPLKVEWLRAVRALGAQEHLYVPYDAYIVRMSPDVRDAVARLPFVQWIGPHHPAYKIPTSLRDARGPVWAAAVAVDGVSEAQFRAAVEPLVDDVRQTSPLPTTAWVVASSEQLRDVARLDATLLLFRDDVASPLDTRAGEIHGFHQAWYRERSGLPSTLTGRSPGPDGIVGTADDIYEIVGIQDTGLDEGSATDGALDFFDGPYGPSIDDRVIRFTDRTDCSTPDGRGGSAHGTHVTGIVISNGYAWEKYLVENQGDTSVSLTDAEWHRGEAGIVPEGKVSFDGVTARFGLSCSGSVSPSPTYWDVQYSDGARTMVNSWGSGIGQNYDATSFAVDDRMDDSDGDGSTDRMIEFSAGNGGPGLGTLGSTAQAKNGLTVGASQNFRPDQFESDNPNLLAGFSSRGGPLQSSGRIKPDIVAVGTSVISNFARGEWQSVNGVPQPGYIMEVDKYSTTTLGPGSDGIPDYQYLQGTSMSGPMAAGLYMLAREYLREVKNIAVPNHYLIKALLINGAVRMNPALYTYPGWDQGWGRIDIKNSLFPDAPRTVQFEEGTTSGATWSPTTINSFVVSDEVPIKITLVWVDPPASGGVLVNNLDLRVTDPLGNVYKGNFYGTSGALKGWSVPNPAGQGNASWDPNGDGWDSVNNVEQVEVEFPAAGTWQIEVLPMGISGTAAFAVVFSADTGPVTSYQVDLSTTHDTAFTIVADGSANLPLVVRNFGTEPDNLLLSAPDAPPGIAVSYAPSASVTLASQGVDHVLATISVAAGVQVGVYRFDVRATSGFDPNPAGPSTDFVPVRVEVVDAALPFAIQVTSDPVDELDPSVLVFNESGTRRVFIAYRRTSAVSADQRTGGVNVWVAHTTLDASGMPILPFQKVHVSSANDDPNDLRMLRIPSGTYADRVIVTWTGSDPNVTGDDDSYGMVAYSDPPYTTWNLRMMERNVGSANFNIARVAFPLFRQSSTAAGQLIWVWEHLDYNDLGAGPQRVQTHMVISTTGGDTWGAPTRVFPVTGGDSNFYFFPTGVVDRNDVAWLIAYWRTPTGNDRDLIVRLFDDAGLSPGASNVLDTTDNVQWPAAVVTDEGGNRVYIVVTRDALAVDLKMWTTYVTGNFNSATLPADVSTGGRSCGAGCTISVDFAGPFGPFGSSVSNANYNRRPILNIVQTVEGATRYIWLPHMENNNPSGVPNLWTYYAGDAFASSPPVTKLTADAFAKGHQMTDTLATGGVPRLYEVYHASKGTATRVNYEVYLLIYARGWESSVDARGPIVSAVDTVPNPVNLTVTTSMRVTANVNDVNTGNSSIAAAEVFFDVLGSPGTGTLMAASDGAFDSTTEGVSYFTTVPGNWSSGECHPVFVRGQDALGNWGPAGSVGVCVTGFSGPDTTPPLRANLLPAILSGPGQADVTVSWGRSADELAPGGTVLYQLYRATDLTGPWTQVGSNITATGQATYTVVEPGFGHGAPSATYFWYARTMDAANNTANTTARAGKLTVAVAAGMNLVSTPFTQADPSLATVLQTVSVVSVHAYVATDAADAWKSYNTARPTNDLTSIDPRMALWLNVSSAGDLTTAGLLPATTTIGLATGWNFVGLPSFRPGYTVAQIKSETGATLVQGFDAAGPYYLRSLGDAELLGAGAGMWIYVSGPRSWDVPSS